MVSPLLEVGPHTIREDCGLPDIEQFAGLVFKRYTPGWSGR